jgi:hypothetical protein
MTPDGGGRQARARHRRGFLTAVGTASAVCLAGCTGGGNGDNDSGNNSSGGNDSSGNGGNSNGEQAPEFESASVPGGDSVVYVGFGFSSLQDITSLVVQFDGIVFEADDGSTVTYPLGGEQIDVGSIEQRQPSVPLVFEEPFPVGEYVTAELYAPVQSVTKEDGTSPGVATAMPLTYDLPIAGDPFTCRADWPSGLSLSVSLFDTADPLEFATGHSFMPERYPDQSAAETGFTEFAGRRDFSNISPPDGEATVSVEFGFPIAETFETLVVDIEGLVFERADGMTVPYPVNMRDVDLAGMAEPRVQVVDGGTVPAGSYSGLRAYVPEQAAVLSDGSVPFVRDDDPMAASLSRGSAGESDPTELIAGESTELTIDVTALEQPVASPVSYLAQLNSDAA